MSLVWERAPYAEGSLLVLLALADWSDDSGYSWPSINGLAQKARLQRRRVQYIIRKLKADDFLAIEEGGGRKKRNRYTLNLTKLNGALSAPFPEINSALSDKETVHFGAETVHSATQTVHPSAPDPLIEPPIDPSVDPPVPFFGRAFELALVAFEAHRKEIRKPLKPTGRKALYQQLAAMGEERAADALWRSIANGWQGVFEERVSNATAKTANERRDAAFRGYAAFADELRSRGSEAVDETVRRKSLAS